MIGEMMARHVDGTIDSYVAKEQPWLDEIRGVAKTYKVVDASFFADAVAKWNTIWEAKAPATLEALRKAAQDTAQ